MIHKPFYRYFERFVFYNRKATLKFFFLLISTVWNLLLQQKIPFDSSKHITCPQTWHDFVFGRMRWSNKNYNSDCGLFDNSIDCDNVIHNHCSQMNSTHLTLTDMLSRLLIFDRSYWLKHVSSIQIHFSICLYLSLFQV